MKNVKFEIGKARTGCQKELIPQRKPKLGCTKTWLGCVRLAGNGLDIADLEINDSRNEM